MADYILTNKAVEDLSDIWNYTFEAWSETQGDRYYHLILDACQELADEKVAGKNYPDIMPAILGFKIGLHVIFYRKLKANKIEIARVLHSRMDLKSNMNE